MRNGKIKIEFLKPWGHPTRWEIYGTGERYWVTPWQAEHLVGSGYAKLVEEEE